MSERPDSFSKRAGSMPSTDRAAQGQVASGTGEFLAALSILVLPGCAAVLAETAVLLLRRHVDSSRHGQKRLTQLTISTDHCQFLYRWLLLCFFRAMPGIASLPVWLEEILGESKSNVPCNRGSINQAYDVDRSNPLGEGSFGKVWRAQQLTSKATYAVKESSKLQAKGRPKLSPEDVGGLRHEMDVMQTLDHTNIVKLVETFEDNSSFWLVLEICEGGRVDDFVAKTGHLTERNVSRIMQQVLGAVAYMHGRSICHRDLKPQNLLLQSCDPIESNTVKVADFGIACACPRGRQLKEKVGSPEYMAPQVLTCKYDLAADLWSCGAVLYTLLCGYPPFHGNSEAQLLAAIARGNYTLKQEDWCDISEDAKSMVRGLLKMNVDERFTADEACGQSWVCHGAPTATQLKVVVRNLRKRPSFKRRKQNAEASDGSKGSALSKLREYEWMAPMVDWANTVLPAWKLPNLQDFQCHSGSVTRSDEQLVGVNLRAF